MSNGVVNMQYQPKYEEFYAVMKQYAELLDSGNNSRYYGCNNDVEFQVNRSLWSRLLPPAMTRTEPQDTVYSTNNQYIIMQPSNLLGRIVQLKDMRIRVMDIEHIDDEVLSTVFAVQYTKNGFEYDDSMTYSDIINGM